jgi:hypothetical protein
MGNWFDKPSALTFHWDVEQYLPEGYFLNLKPLNKINVGDVGFYDTSYRNFQPVGSVLGTNRFHQSVVGISRHTKRVIFGGVSHEVLEQSKGVISGSFVLKERFLFYGAPALVLEGTTDREERLGGNLETLLPNGMEDYRSVPDIFVVTGCLRLSPAYMLLRTTMGAPEKDLVVRSMRRGLTNELCSAEIFGQDAVDQFFYSTTKAPLAALIKIVRLPPLHFSHTPLISQLQRSEPEYSSIIHRRESKSSHPK